MNTNDVPPSVPWLDDHPIKREFHLLNALQFISVDVLPLGPEWSIDSLVRMTEDDDPFYDVVVRYIAFGRNCVSQVIRSRREFREWRQYELPHIVHRLIDENLRDHDSPEAQHARYRVSAQVYQQ